MCIDVTTAFLYGDLDAEIYMTISEGYELATDEMIQNDECVVLQRPIYGLVQSARQYWKKFVNKLKKEKNFGMCECDPCLLYRIDDDGPVYLCMYVDDVLIVGTRVTIDKAVRDIEDCFEITVDGTLKDYLGCEIHFSEDKKSAWLGQPHLIKNLKRRFGHMVDGKNLKTPGTPGFKVFCVEDIKLGVKDQKIYCSGVGMMLYLVKHSRPDLANPVRELSKVMDGATNFHLKELLRIINHTLNNETLSLRMRPGSQYGIMWILKGLCDSDWGQDKETRKSITGFIIYLNEVAISWRSKAQGAVALSSTEAEYYALSEAVAEIKFIAQLLKFLDIEIEFPIIVHIDNIGAIYLSRNATSGNRTKHIDTCIHFV